MDADGLLRAEVADLLDRDLRAHLLRAVVEDVADERGVRVQRVAVRMRRTAIRPQLDRIALVPLPELAADLPAKLASFNPRTALIGALSLAFLYWVRKAMKATLRRFGAT